MPGSAYGVLTWLRFTYAVVGDRLEIRQGVFERKVRVVPVARIRGVDVSASALHRLLGLVRVEVEAASGGSKRAELTLAAVTRAEGEALRLRLLAGPTRAARRPTTSVARASSTVRRLAC